MEIDGCSATRWTSSNKLVVVLRILVRNGLENMDASSPLMPSFCTVSAICADVPRMVSTFLIILVVDSWKETALSTFETLWSIRRTRTIVEKIATTRKSVQTVAEIASMTLGTRSTARMNELFSPSPPAPGPPPSPPSPLQLAFGVGCGVKGGGRDGGDGERQVWEDVVPDLYSSYGS